MAVKISKVLTRAEANQLAALLGEAHDLIDSATTSRSGIWTGEHCSVFYLAREDRYRIVYLSQHVRRVLWDTPRSKTVTGTGTWQVARKAPGGQWVLLAAESP